MIMIKSYDSDPIKGIANRPNWDQDPPPPNTEQRPNCPPSWVEDAGSTARVISFLLSASVREAFRQISGCSRNSFQHQNTKASHTKWKWQIRQGGSCEGPCPETSVSVPCSLACTIISKICHCLGIVSPLPSHTLTSNAPIHQNDP